MKFLYRETAEEHGDTPLTQEVQYDLGESDVIGFKGARIKILESTNTKLRYIVLKNFPALEQTEVAPSKE